MMEEKNEKAYFHKVHECLLKKNCDIKSFLTHSYKPLSKCAEMSV